MTTRLMISTDFHGSTEDGNRFDDSLILKDINKEALTKIVLCHRQSIDSMTMHYTGGGTAVTRGSDAGTRTEVVLAPGEFITTISGIFYDERVAQLGFTTNKGVNFGPYGGHDANVTTRFTWNADDKVPESMAGRMGLLYFSGRSNGYIRQLRATFALYPSGTKPLTVVKFEKRLAPEPAVHGVDLSSFARNMMSPVVALHVGPDSVIFYAQEATLCRVPFFRAALQGQFREAVEKKITMPEEKPEVISALIEHTSTGNYTYTYAVDAATDQHGAPTPDLAQGCFHVGVYAVASAYDWPPLVSDALDNFVSVLSQLRGVEILRLWQAAYDKGLTLPVCAGTGRLVVFEKRLPKFLKELYKTDGEEMDNMVAEFPALASDFMRFLVSGCED